MPQHLLEKFFQNTRGYSAVVGILSLAHTGFSAERQPKHHFSVGPVLLYNISASFSGGTHLSLGVNPGPLSGSGIDRSYDDGYVRVDSEGNASGLTWNWGYQNPAQLPGNDSLLLHQTTYSSAGNLQANGDEPHAGVDFSYAWTARSLSRWAWGAKASFAFANIEIENAHPRSVAAQVLTDTYALGGIVAPGDPLSAGWQYQGTFDLPGPVIADQPSDRSIVQLANAGVVVGHRSLDADIMNWNVGPWIEMFVNERLSLSASAGLSVAMVAGRFEFNETAQIPGFPTVGARGAHSETDWILGPYVEAGLRVRIADQWTGFASGRFQSLSEFEIAAGGRKASLDAEKIWSLIFGFGYSF